MGDWVRFNFRWSRTIVPEVVVSCILGEMFERRPILMGESDAGQLDAIFNLCGSPNEDIWPGWTQLKGCEGWESKALYSPRISARFNKYVENALKRQSTDSPRLAFLLRLVTCFWLS